MVAPGLGAEVAFGEPADSFALFFRRQQILRRQGPPLIPHGAGLLQQPSLALLAPLEVMLHGLGPGHFLFQPLGRHYRVRGYFHTHRHFGPPKTIAATLAMVFQGQVVF